MELARGQVEEHRLPLAPADPRQHVVEAEQREYGIHAQLLEAAADLAGIDLLAGCIQLAIDFGLDVVHSGLRVPSPVPSSAGSGCAVRTR